MLSKKVPRTLPSERGSSSLEFLTVGLLFLLPLVYVVFAVSHVQSAQLAVEGAARGSARLYARTGSVSQDSVPLRVVEMALRDHNFADTVHDVSARCFPVASDCAVPGSHVVVDVSIDVTLPGIPDVLSRSKVGTIRVVGRAQHAVSRFAAQS